jgi:hypothetical protein
MRKLSRIVAAAAVAVCVPAGLLMAQNAPATGSDTTATPAPATAPADTAPAPAATTPAPAAATSAPATTTPAAPAATQNDQPAKKKKTVKMTRQQEIDRSIDSGTVPSRYRKQVPKEYQQYIPFSK